MMDIQISNDVKTSFLDVLSLQLKAALIENKITIDLAVGKELSLDTEKWLDDNNYCYFIDEKENYNYFTIFSDPIVKEDENNEENS